MITQLQEYLDYYRKIENPGYAVLVTGEWGSGKTVAKPFAQRPK